MLNTHNRCLTLRPARTPIIHEDFDQTTTRSLSDCWLGSTPRICAFGADYAAVRISSKLNGRTNKFGWLQAPVTNLIVSQGLPESLREVLPAPGTIGDRNHFSLCDFRPIEQCAGFLLRRFRRYPLPRRLAIPEIPSSNPGAFYDAAGPCKDRPGSFVPRPVPQVLETARLA